MPTWSDSKVNYVNGDVPTNAQLQNLSDNVSVLLARPYQEYIGPTSPDLTTTSASYVDMGSYTVSVTTAKTGGVLYCYFTGTFTHGSAGGEVRVKLTATGLNSIGSGTFSVADIIIGTANDPYPIALELIGFTNSTSHTIKIQWDTPSGTAKLLASYRSHLFVQEGIN